MDSREEKALISCRPRMCETRLWLIILISMVFAHSGYAQSEFEERWGIKRLVEFHQARHPNLHVQDVCKLLYQSCFGVEHILSDSSEVAAYLTSELASVDSPLSGEQLLERISSENDLVRVNLRPFKALNLDPAALVKAMFQSARETIPDTLMFYRLWNELAALVKYGLLNFPVTDLKVWDEKVGGGTIQPVHHSAEYAAANRPAYRVVKRTVFDDAFGRK
ncbi:MAG: hypothetical protein HW412_892 [Bacteroidetes bacterium]|nr:hypothetical protein [Bacteroidota bacterium]